MLTSQKRLAVASAPSYVLGKVMVYSLSFILSGTVMSYASLAAPSAAVNAIRKRRRSALAKLMVVTLLPLKEGERVSKTKRIPETAEGTAN